MSSGASPSPESRQSLSRARHFLERAAKYPASERVDFEADVEAAIVFSRAAIHRFQRKHKGHPGFKAWWASIESDPAVQFLRDERNQILKEGPTRIGQQVWISGNAASTSGAAPENPRAYQPQLASEFYSYEDVSIPATATVERHLSALEVLLENAEKQVFT